MMVDVAGTRYVTNCVTVRDKLGAVRTGLTAPTRGSSWTSEAGVAQEMPCRQVVASARTILEGRVEAALTEAMIDSADVISKAMDGDGPCAALHAIEDADDLCEEVGAAYRRAGGGVTADW